MSWKETGFAAHMVPLPPGATTDERKARSRSMLLRALDTRTVIAVVGAGCSKPLGYPRWSEFARQLLNRAIRVVGEDSLDGGRLADYRRALRREQREDLIMFYLGACQEALARHRAAERERAPGGADRDHYQEYIHKTFRGRGLSQDVPASSADPYRHLVDLPILRFVTTNYDCEIERALRQYRGVPEAAFAIRPPSRPEETKDERERTRLRLSFHQDRKFFNELAVFGLAGLRENRNMVFHCHGRFDDIASIVASERDYQQWYFLDDKDAAAGFRQSVEMLLASNPLLFVGYGLGDDDLLRPLRHLVAANPQRKPSRPIFALLEIEKAADSNRHEMLYERYGLHVLPYSCEGKSKAEALCNELTALRSDWQDARQNWLRKPKLRTPSSHHSAPAPYVDINKTPLPAEPLPDLEKAVEKPGIVAFRSPSGDGKTIGCLSLIEELHARGRFPAGIFYWNFHYGCELLTVFDTLLAYLHRGEPYDASVARPELLRRHLAAGPYLIVLDACERLLHKENNGAGPLVYSTLFAQILDAFRDQKRSTVILAGRILPDLADARVVTAQPITSRALAGYTFYPRLGRLADGDRVTLCTLLKGHNFALMLAAQHLEELPDGFDDLVSQLSERSHDQRLREMVLIRLRKIDERSGGLATPFLRHLALFLNPVCDSTLEICYAEARRRAKALGDTGAELSAAPLDGGLETLRRQLLDAFFLFEATSRRDGARATCVHATVRSQFLRPFHGQSADALPDFGLSGFLSGRVGVDPGPQSYQEIVGLFQALEGAARQAVAKDDLQVARNLCRDAVNLLRSRMEANTAARWSKSLEEYSRMGIRTALLAKRVSPGSWLYGEPNYAAAMDDNAPIYLGELAWLYNDVALALSAMGQLRDAYAVWEQTYEIGRLVERPEAGSGLQIESLLSLALCFIEMGRLPAARKILEEAPEKRLNQDVSARILGLRALLQHLQGDLPKADEMYRSCLEMLAQGQNLRAQSYFSKQRADLKISLGDLGGAKVLIRESRAMAESGVFPDLVLLARVTEGHIETHERRHAGARIVYDAVLSEAQRLSLRKLESESYVCLARVALNEKDTEGTRQYAMKSLMIANELGLGLRVTHSLVILGLAMLNAGQRNLGVAYLRHAKRLADDQEYWHRGWEAERKLQELGERP